jgi:hypothetical protein
VGIFELALDDTWLGFIADVPDYSDSDSPHRCLTRHRIRASDKPLGHSIAGEIGMAILRQLKERSVPSPCAVISSLGTLCSYER